MYCAESTRLAPHRSTEAMPRSKSPSPVTSLQQQLTDATHAFAQGILRVLGTSTLSGLTALTGRQAAPEPPGKPQQGIDSVEPPRRKQTSPRTRNLRRLAGTKPVICPVPGCEATGVRSKMNFCNEHSASLSQDDRVHLRQQQRAGHRTEKVEVGDEIKGGRKRRTKKE